MGDAQPPLQRQRGVGACEGHMTGQCSKHMGWVRGGKRPHRALCAVAPCLDAAAAAYHTARCGCACVAPSPAPPARSRLSPPTNEQRDSACAAGGARGAGGVEGNVGHDNNRKTAAGRREGPEGSSGTASRQSRDRKRGRHAQVHNSRVAATSRPIQSSPSLHRASQPIGTHRPSQLRDSTQLAAFCTAAVPP